MALKGIVRAYLEQARSDFRVFERLAADDRQRTPECHPLHYLQMCSEKLAKAVLLALDVEGFDRFSHVAFSQLPYQLRRQDVARVLGWQTFDGFKAFLRKIAPSFRAIDELNPAIGTSRPNGGGKDGPNVEYPWPGRGPGGGEIWIIPCNHNFGLLEELRTSADSRGVLPFIESLLNRFEALFDRTD